MCAKKSETTTGTKMRLEDFPGLVEAKGKLEAIMAKQAEARAALTEEIAARDEATAAMSNYETAARALLDGQDLEAARTAAKERARSLTGDVEILDRAVELARAQFNEVMRHASGAVVDSRKTEHVELVQAIFEAIDDLVAAFNAEVAWIDGLRSEGIQFSTGMGGTVNPVSHQGKPFFDQLRRFDLKAYRRRLVEGGYLR